MLDTKMVQQSFGIAGNDISIGANILTRAALTDEFAAASGQYFDNDSSRFASPHPDALNTQKCKEIVHAIEAILAEIRPRSSFRPLIQDKHTHIRIEDFISF